MLNNIHLIVGARPNFVKCAVLYAKLKESGFNIKLIHTGQHYSSNMSDIFFNDLDIPREDINLNVGSSTHAEQTGRIMIEYEKILFDDRPDLIMVFGDVNSTIATVLAGAKLHVKTAHIEAGLRSNDRTMPEEINRIATDVICDYLFAPGSDGVENLREQGIPDERIFLVGNIMIDTLTGHMDKIAGINIENTYNVKKGEYVFLTLHRPSNVDNKDRLNDIVCFLNRIAAGSPIVFPAHPRTVKNLEGFGLKEELSDNIRMIKPISYLSSIAMIRSASAVITDSGGIQEETTFLGVPCFTLRKNTERPVTVEEGTNMLIEPEEKHIDDIINSSPKQCSIKYWDGNTSERIISVIKEL
ncbi:MAG: UDP-N-acetylglucosamine 2-epimerase (non-hydrolyzing) [candidate division WOR-3 bacterium]|nr:UDP-N-acetylglucosamine 2-epimerase (non-hydrolyzing) [candidate division WOR-3 bacterium]